MSIAKSIIISIAGLVLMFLYQPSFSQEDEFEAWDDGQQQEESFDEFAPLEEGDIADISTLSESDSCGGACGGCSSSGKSNSKLWWILSILAYTILAGIMVRYKSTRNLRGVFLLISFVVLGFYRGGCPCPIMSLHHTLFSLFGIEVNWIGMIWLLGLIPITYFFGKVWCGWVCHLGALQEFLYLPGKFKMLQTEKAQRIMRIVRIVLLVALVLQVLITKTNLFKTIDPFKVAFNLRSVNIMGWILLGLLIVSSVFMYRPFCKTMCPIGLILGWVSKIPGASVLAPRKSTCVACKTCDVSCSINAITRNGRYSVLDNQECIACGNCVADCKKGSMSFFRNSDKYGSKSTCKAD
ncbi:MAG TPA: 4Fe-4S binding protein [Prolixibacteraceae bacterium]|nr:4Fe-4S binding protein [Prolixibacteraceae bacterium]